MFTWQHSLTQHRPFLEGFSQAELKQNHVFHFGDDHDIRCTLKVIQKVELSGIA
jgi:hypothetical protein